MIKNYFHKKNMSYVDKIFAFDFYLIFLVLLLGIISFFAMYSSERGTFSYHTQSHLYRFSVFFLLFILISFLNIKLIYKFAYIFYIIVLILLLGVDFFGITASGSKRWINLFFINLQPSELMKISLIIFLARYYHKIPSQNVNNLKHIFIPFFSFLIPVYLVVKQPDLGTAVLIAMSGLIVIWLTGFRIKYFLYSFFVSSSDSIFKTIPKSKNSYFFEPGKRSFGSGVSNYPIKNCCWVRRIFWKGISSRKSKLFRLFA